MEINMPADTKRYQAFEQLYLEAREREQRIYSDAELAKLPEVPPSHLHFEEWQARKRSAVRLVQYLKHKNQPLSILEVGCGNGWLSSLLAGIDQVTVLGIDVNATELWQGAKVFRNKANLSFEYGDLRDEKFDGRKFDIVVFSASLQYFPSLPEILGRALSMLSLTGEVHILDTIFYDETEVMRAHFRTLNYYTSIGCPDMSAYYFHHTWHSMRQFDFQVMYHPTWFTNRILNMGPFYWICVTPDM